MIEKWEKVKIFGNKRKGREIWRNFVEKGEEIWRKLEGNKERK